MKLVNDIKKSNFMSIFISYFFMTFGNRIGQFGILFFIWFSLKDAAIIGMMFLIQTTAKASSGFIFNILSRWFKTSTLFSASFIIRMINYFLFILYFSFLNNWFILTLLLVVHSLVESFVEPVIYSTISNKIPEENYNKYNSLVSLIDNISLFVSPVIGSLLITICNNKIHPLLLVVSLLFFLGYIFIFNKRLFFEHNEKISKIPFSKGLKLIIFDKTIVYLLITFMIFNLFMFPLLSIIFPSYIILENNLGAGYVAYFEILFSSGLIITSALQVFSSSSPFKAKVMIIVSFILGGIGLLWLSIIPWVILSGIGSFIIGVCLSMLRINNTTFMQHYIDKKIQKDFFAIRSSILLSVAPISSAIVSITIEYFGSKIIMLIGGMVLLLLAISLYPVLFLNLTKKRSIYTTNK